MPAWVLAAAFLLPPAHAAEAPVARMSVRMSLDADGTLTIVESLRAEVSKAEPFGAGFYRDIPAQRLRLNGLRSLSRVSLVDSRAGGEQAAVSLRRTERGLRASFPPIDHAAQRDYDLVYRVESALGFFPDRDELHWTAAPNEWGSAVHDAEVEFDLDGRALQSAAARAGDRDLPGIENSGVLKFKTGLNPKESLRITLAFAPGTFPRPDEETQKRRLIADNFHLAVGAFGFLVLLIFILRCRAKSVTPEDGMPPAAGAPADLSPAAARFCAYGAADASSLAAAMLSCEKAGYLKLEEGRLSIGDAAARTKLWGEERAACDALLKGETSIVPDRAALERGISALALSLQSQWTKRLAALRLDYAVQGWALTAGVFAAMRAAADPLGGAWPALACGFAALLLGLLVAGLWLATYAFWKEASNPKNLRRLPVSLLAAIFGCVSFGAVTWAADFLRRLYLDASPLLNVEAAAFLLLNMAALAVLRGPTRDGWRALTQASALRSLRAEQLLLGDDASFAAAFEAPVGDKAPESLRRVMALLQPLRS